LTIFGVFQIAICKKKRIRVSCPFPNLFKWQFENTSIMHFSFCVLRFLCFPRLLWKVENFLWITDSHFFRGLDPVEIHFSFHIGRGKEFLVKTRENTLFHNPHSLLMLTTVIYSLFLSKRERRKEICDEVSV